MGGREAGMKEHFGACIGVCAEKRTVCVSDAYPLSIVQCHVVHCAVIALNSIPAKFIFILHNLKFITDNLNS